MSNTRTYILSTVVLNVRTVIKGHIMHTSIGRQVHMTGAMINQVTDNKPLVTLKVRQVHSSHTGEDKRIVWRTSNMAVISFYWYLCVFCLSNTGALLIT